MSGQKGLCADKSGAHVRPSQLPLLLNCSSCGLCNGGEWVASIDAMHKRKTNPCVQSFQTGADELERHTS